MRAFGVRSTVVVVLLLAVLPLLGPPVAAETAQEEAAPDEMSETFRIGPFDLAPQGQPGTR